MMMNDVKRRGVMTTSDVRRYRIHRDDRLRPTFAFLNGGGALPVAIAVCMAPRGGDLLPNNVHHGVSTHMVRSFVQTGRVSYESTSMTHFDDVRWMVYSAMWHVRWTTATTGEGERGQGTGG